MNYNQIFETVDYSEFNWTEINRDIVPSQVKALETDIENGFDIQTPILVNPQRVNGKLQVPDGQHRLVALRNKKRPIRYIFATRQMSLNDITRINTQQRPWKTMDYLKAFAKAGNQDYIKLLNFHEEVNERAKKVGVDSVSVRVSAYLTQGNTTNPTDRDAKSMSIKNGNWKFLLSDSDARKNLNLILDFAEVNPGVFTEAFIQKLFGLMRNEEKFEAKRLLRQAKKFPWKFIAAGRGQDYMRMIEELYNHKKHDKNKVYFRFN